MWCFSFSFCLFFHFFPTDFFVFCFVIVDFLFLFLFSLSFFLLHYQLYHRHLLIPTLIPFSLPPSPVLKSIALLPNNSFRPFSLTLSPCPHVPLPFSLNLSPDYPSFLHTHHPLTNLLYQLYTTPNPCKHPPLQQQKYTQTHTRTTKLRSRCPTSPTHPPHFLPPPLVTPHPTSQISIATLTNNNPPNSHCL
jgi:hypothetical protein